MRVIALLMAATLSCGVVHAQVPHKIGYQGLLTSSGGTPITATVSMVFKLYNVGTGGTELYTETQSVAVNNGAFNVLIGSVTPLPLPFDVQYYLGITVGGDPEMAPRQPLAASPYALRSASTESLAAGGSAGQVLAGTGAAPAWTGSPALGGNLTLASPSTASAGNIMKGATPFIHNFGTSNTFIGEDAGNLNPTLTGSANTASGASALLSNTSGNSNTATGSEALTSNTTGGGNTATGVQALAGNVSGSTNTASGVGALFSNIGGSANTATGQGALSVNTAGNNNTATGAGALGKNMGAASNNTAIGWNALQNNTTGTFNIAVGYAAGSLRTINSYSIDIGNVGVAGEGNTIRIGNAVNQTRTFIAGIRGQTTDLTDAVAVLIDSNGQLGTVSSSRRFKDNIADMDAASSALMKLRPVTFHYKTDRNPAGRSLQYGLIAEEVAKVYPGLIAHSADGQIETVLYQFLPPMLLNEYQKLQRTIEAQAARIDSLEKQTVELALLKQQVAQLAHFQQQAEGLAGAAAWAAANGQFGGGPADPRAVKAKLGSN